MKILMAIIALILVSSCTSKVYHRKHGWVSMKNNDFRYDGRDCLEGIEKRKKYKNDDEMTERFIVCMMEKGWRM